MRILHRSLILTASILAVNLIISLSDLWRPTIRGIGFYQTLQWLINEGYTPEEIAKHTEIARLTRGVLRFPPDLSRSVPDHWTKSDAQVVDALLAVMDQMNEEFKRSHAVSVARSIEWELRRAPVVKKLAVKGVIIFALETLREDEGPFTIENSLPTSLRTEVEEAFGGNADAVLLQIEEAYSTYGTSTRVLETHGGFEGFVNHLVDIQFVPSEE